MNTPKKCKDCIYLKLYILDSKKTIEPKCMLGHSLSLSSGCPNKKKDIYGIS